MLSTKLSLSYQYFDIAPRLKGKLVRLLRTNISASGETGKATHKNKANNVRLRIRTQDNRKGDKINPSLNRHLGIIQERLRGSFLRVLGEDKVDLLALLAKVKEVVRSKIFEESK